MRASSSVAVACALVGALAILTPTRLEAQTILAKGGLDFTVVKLPSGRLADEVLPKPGLTGGGVVRLGLFGRLGVQAEALVSRKRTTLDAVVTHTVNVVEVPVLLRYRLFSPHGRAVHVYGGGFYASVLSATETVLDESFDLKDGIAASDVGAIVGGDVALWKRLSLDARYVHGTEKVYNTLSGRLGTRWSMQVGVTYRVLGQ